MPRTVYVLGAGVNQLFRDWQGRTPPMVGDVFAVASRMGILDHPWLPKSFFDFIHRISKLDRSQLPATNLNFEECFDRATAELTSALTSGDAAKIGELAEVRFLLLQVLASTIQKFLGEGFSGYPLGEILWREQASIITFNYDSLIEEALELASGVPPGLHVSAEVERQRAELYAHQPGDSARPTPLLDYRDSNWSRNLGCGIRFDEVPLREPDGRWLDVAGTAYYAHPGNALHPLKLLKLHGSYSWFRYTSFAAYQGHGLPPPEFGSRPGRLILHHSGWIDVASRPAKDGILLDPVVITGTKTDGAISIEPFLSLWRQAHEVLADCTRLVVIGYSFDARDQLSLDLLRNSVNLDSLERLLFVTPSRKSMAATMDRLGWKGGANHIPTITEYVWRHPITRASRQPPIDPVPFRVS